MDLLNFNNFENEEKYFLEKAKDYGNKTLFSQIEERS